MADPIVVSKDHAEINYKTTYTEHTFDSSRHQHVASNFPQVTTTGSVMQLGGPEDVALTETAEQLINESTRPKTKTKYNCVIRKWHRYCEQTI